MHGLAPLRGPSIRGRVKSIATAPTRGRHLHRVEPQLTLQALCRDKLLQLSSHSWEKTLALAIRYPEAIPPSDVISQLEKFMDEQQRLLHYLHELFLHDVHLGSAFHGQQLRLYGKHKPEQLMAFLRGSPHYPLDLALEVCRKLSLVEEQASRTEPHGRA